MNPNVKTKFKIGDHVRSADNEVGRIVELILPEIANIFSQLSYHVRFPHLNEWGSFNENELTKVYDNDKTYPMLQQFGDRCVKIHEVSGKQLNKENNVSNYNFNVVTKAALNKNVVEVIVRKAVEEQTGKKIASITFKCSELKGSEAWSNASIFTGCDIVFAPDTK